MLIEYNKPSVEIISFMALEQMASAQQERSTRDETGGMGGSMNLPSMPEFSEGVEEWD